MNESIFEFDENGCSSSTPSIDDAFQLYFKTPVGAAFFCMAFVSTFSTLAIYLYAMYKIRQHNPVGTERRRALTLVFGLFPVTVSLRSVSGVTSHIHTSLLCVPRRCALVGCCTTEFCVQTAKIKDPNAINFWLGIISGFSTGFAVYGLQIFSKSSQEYLEKYYVKTKFVAVQLVLILTGLVRLVMDILGFTESITCRGPLRSPERGQIIYNHVTIHIMATCIIGFFVYWIWLSRFSSRRNEVEHPVEVPESPTSTAQPSEMDDKAEETKEV
ncbi:hypothetical protein HOLleu_39588 [Holothuria leucospilota]|uniref:Uncharacterized protein n=1 Tax=Holothuria leucospilota TaxID=206669 RepID=A0A9Q1BD18_HOLLE|nr:hypothetical protein HOLleu_39588 [Holothuria leucospilota]